LARSLWQQHPPLAGDIGLWGDTLPAFLEVAMVSSEALAAEAYLPGIARLEWAVHGAGRAADAMAPHGLALLAESDPANLRLLLAPGTAVVESKHPVVSIWLAHQHPGSDTPPSETPPANAPSEDSFAGARAALAAGLGETALVCRRGWRVHVQALPLAHARFTQAVLSGQSLAQALDAAAGVSGPAFAFEAWLIQALQTQLLVAVFNAD
jgi:hypothetical protein